MAGDACCCLPSSNDISLGSANGDVVANNKELDFDRFGWMVCSKLFFCQTEVENVSCVVPGLVVSPYERREGPCRYT